jgi:hypothetical protein
MKATKLITIFEAEGALNAMILEQVTKNNSGEIQYRLNKIKRFGERTVKLGLVPTTTFDINEEGNVMTVKQEGKTTVIIEENTIAEMQFREANQ